MSLKWTIALTLLPAGPLHAQVSNRALVLRDSSARTIMARLRRGTYPSWFIDVMRETSGVVSRVKLDEIADSLVGRAVGGSPAVESASGHGAKSAADLLAAAGNRGPRRGTPYTGALDRLIEIHKRSTDFAVRSSALAAMPGIVGRERGLSYLRTVATSNDSTAWYAVSVLMTDAIGGHSYGPAPSASESMQSEQILRELYEDGSVRDDGAKLLLKKWARQKGY